MVAEADDCFIASPAAVPYVSRVLRRAFKSLPNCEPLAALRPRKPRSEGPCRFLFLGGVSQQRGLVLLVKAWLLLRSDAVLTIQGPRMDAAIEQELIQEAGELLGQTVFLADPAPQDALLSTAAMHDVGVISYEPVSNNNRFCCPNKLSQYMAAGLPILSNVLEFPSELIGRWGAGVSVDFADTRALAEAIDAIAINPAAREQMGEQGQRCFAEEFHWEAQSLAFYDALDRTEGSFEFTPRLAPTLLGTMEREWAMNGLKAIAPIRLEHLGDRAILHMPGAVDVAYVSLRLEAPADLKIECYRPLSGLTGIGEVERLGNTATTKQSGNLTETVVITALQGALPSILDWTVLSTGLTDPPQTA